MFSVFNLSTLTMGIIYDVILRIEFDVEKNNLVVGVYGVFGLVSYRNNNIRWLFYVCIKFVFECGDRRQGFCFFR